MLPKPRSKARLLSIIIPVFNEALVLPELKVRLIRLADKLPVPVEIIFVNDGSTDRTIDFLISWAEDDRRIKVIDFARNFGQQVAITAGQDLSNGDAVVIMDSDLQDPPELITDLLKKYHLGYEVVIAKRSVRHGENIFKKMSSAAFYWTMRKLVAPNFKIQEGDFCLLSSSAIAVLRELRETHRFMRGLIGWVGFPVTFVDFERDGRSAGETKYTLTKMVKLAIDAALSFSALPLRLVVVFGLFVFSIGVAFGFYSLTRLFWGGYVVPGWVSLAVLECLLGGATLFAVGLIGEYVARIYEETKHRPLYVVRATANLENAVQPKRAVINLSAGELIAFNKSPRKLRGNSRR